LRPEPCREFSSSGLSPERRACWFTVEKKTSPLGREGGEPTQDHEKVRGEKRPRGFKKKTGGMGVKRIGRGVFF